MGIVSLLGLLAIVKGVEFHLDLLWVTCFFLTWMLRRIFL